MLELGYCIHIAQHHLVKQSLEGYVYQFSNLNSKKRDSCGLLNKFCKLPENFDKFYIYEPKFNNEYNCFVSQIRYMNEDNKGKKLLLQTPKLKIKSEIMQFVIVEDIPTAQTNICSIAILTANIYFVM